MLAECKDAMCEVKSMWGEEEGIFKPSTTTTAVYRQWIREALKEDDFL